MYQKERIDKIMEILKENGYVTVKYLTDKLHYSNATVNRDLNIMESRKLITRSYGGDDAVRTVLKYNTDKMFFSVGGINLEGSICSKTTIYNMIYFSALKNAREVYFLIDHSKVNLNLKYNIIDLSGVNAVISDYAFSAEMKEKFKNTRFYEV